MFLDAILFYAIYPHPYFRFGRILRPVKCIIESRHVNRTVYAILKTFPQIIDVFVMLLIISMLYALVGNRFLDSEIAEITRESDLSRLDYGTQNIYFLVTLSNYPGMLLPYVNHSSMNCLYFLPFIVFAVLIVLPLPVAVVFEAFKRNRSQILLKDRLIEKEALFLSFLCLDFQRRGYVNATQWDEFVSAIYNGRHDKRKVSMLFEMLDERNIGYMNCEAFFQGCELIYSIKHIKKSRFGIAL